MATLHSRPQALESAVLKLLHGAFAPGQLLRNFTNAFLLHETLEDHPALVFGKVFDQSKQASPMFDCLQIRLNTRFRRCSRAGCNFSGGALGLIRYGIGGNPEQPRGEWRASIFVAPQIGKRFVKNIRGQIFRRLPIVYATGDERIYSFEMNLIQVSKLEGVPLRSFNQQTLVWLFRDYFCCRSSDGHRSSDYINWRRVKKSRT
jgi:hypothetical protein